MKCDKKAMLLYAVTDRAWVGRQSLYEQVESALKGGASCVQLREKELDEEEFLKEAMELSALCRKYGVPFFINDNVDILGQQLLQILCAAANHHIHRIRDPAEGLILTQTNRGDIRNRKCSHLQIFELHISNF